MSNSTSPQTLFLGTGGPEDGARICHSQNETEKGKEKEGEKGKEREGWWGGGEGNSNLNSKTLFYKVQSKT